METAQRLISNLRSTDILARFGGEEFVVLLPDTGLDGSHSAAARLHRSIRGQKFQTSAADLDITISLGIAFLSDEISTMASLLDHADSALYAAKESGRDRLVLGGQIE
jgi:diguanylate cyclase (GGDEF)-like protein